MRPKLPRISLAPLPTPVESLPRLTRALGGAKIFVKRDDLTGLAGGGNKARKLELLVGDALARGADTLVTLGSAQSNHCRQTAAAAARCGLRAILVLGGAPPPDATGNLLLDHLLGAELRWSGARARARRSWTKPWEPKGAWDGSPMRSRSAAPTGSAP